MTCFNVAQILLFHWFDSFNRLFFWVSFSFFRLSWTTKRSKEKENRKFRLPSPLILDFFCFRKSFVSLSRIVWWENRAKRKSTEENYLNVIGRLVDCRWNQTQIVKLSQRDEDEDDHEKRKKKKEKNKKKLVWQQQKVKHRWENGEVKRTGNATSASSSLPSSTVIVTRQKNKELDFSSLLASHEFPSTKCIARTTLDSDSVKHMCDCVSFHACVQLEWVM